MSWSLSVPQSSPEDFENAARKAHADHQNANGAWEPEAVEHFMGALRAAKAMAESMAPDGWEHQLIVSMTGHANPNHAPQDGMSNDTMTVTVTQVPTNQIPPEQAQPAPEDVKWDTTQAEPQADPNQAPPEQAGTPATQAAQSQPPDQAPSTPEGVPPMPSRDNPVPVDQAKEAAPVWEQQMAPADLADEPPAPAASPAPQEPTSEGNVG